MSRKSFSRDLLADRAQGLGTLHPHTGWKGHFRGIRINGRPNRHLLCSPDDYRSGTLSSFHSKSANHTQLSTFSQRGAIREAFQREKTRDPDAFKPHSDYVRSAHESYGPMRKRLLGDNPLPYTDEDSANTDEKESEMQVSTEDSEETLAEGQGDGLGKRSEGEKGGQKQSGGDRIKSAQRKGRQDEDDNFNTNQDNIASDVERIEGSQASSSPRGGAKRNGHGGKGDRGGEHALEVDLFKQLMDLTVQLEAEARQMMLDSMEKGIARTLLLADRNGMSSYISLNTPLAVSDFSPVQVRDVKALRGDDANMLAIWRGEEEKTAQDQKDKAATGPRTEGSAEQLDMLSRVRRYRNTFAEILVVGSILQKLEGEELNRFERWRTIDEAEKREASKEGMEDLKDVAEERYDGITGMIFKRKAKRREKDFAGLMAIAEKGKDLVGKGD